MTTAQRIAIATPATGLMVFDTTTSNFWFYNGTIWSQVGGNTSGWGLAGNTGTDTATNFIGTTDNKPLIFRTNNIGSGIIHPGQGLVALGTESMLHNTSGTQNTAMGAEALNSNTDGNDNSAHGAGALYNNTSGTGNTVQGRNAMYENTTGSYNTANGSKALINNSTGYSNVAVGSGSLYANTTVSNLVAIGDSAMYNNGNRCDPFPPRPL
jgi:hypothetical protein